MKTCTKCGETKPLDEFGKAKSKIDGRQSHCRVCRRRYYEANREKVVGYRRRYYATNRERVTEKNRHYRETNLEKAAEYQRRYYADNKEKVAEYQRRYCANNKEKVAEMRRRWSEANPERVAEMRKCWSEANPEKRVVSKNRRRARKKAARVDESPADVARRTAVHFIAVWLREQGDDVHVDHILPLAKGGADSYNNLQILSKRANLSKNDRLPNARELKRIELLKLSALDHERRRDLGVQDLRTEEVLHERRERRL